MKKSKQLLLITALLFIWELPVIAQQPTDTTYIFRFVPNDDMFYVPWNGNDRSLHQLLNILEKNKKQLQAGQMYISVSSYAASANDILTSERMAYIRNNRIKSELITQGGLTEQMFVTDRAILSSYGKEKLRNVVVVTFPASVEKVAEIAGIEAARRVENYNKERSGKAERERQFIEQAAKQNDWRKNKPKENTLPPKKRPANKQKPKGLRLKEKKKNVPKQSASLPKPPQKRRLIRSPCEQICSVGVLSPPTSEWNGA